MEYQKITTMVLRGKTNDPRVRAGARVPSSKWIRRKALKQITTCQQRAFLLLENVMPLS